MATKLHIKKGDTVYVNSGEDKGKTGRVIMVMPKTQRAIVEGVNMVTKHKKQPDAQNPNGGIVHQEAAIHVSNLNVVEGGIPVRIGRREENGKNVRYSKKTGEVIK